jgi:hypothetical protein
VVRPGSLRSRVDFRLRGSLPAGFLRVAAKEAVYFKKGGRKPKRGAAFP